VNELLEKVNKLPEKTYATHCCISLEGLKKITSESLENDDYGYLEIENNGTKQ